MAQFVLQPDGVAGVDAEIVLASSNINFGDSLTLRMGAYAYSKTAASPFRALLRFDLSSVPAGATVDGATLTLFAAGGVLPSGGTIDLYRVTQTAWTETGVTWSWYDGTNDWGTAGGDYTALDADSATVAGPTEDLVFASLANLVDDAIANRSGLLHLLLIGPESGSVDNYYEGYGSDDLTAATRPKLVIDYTPLGPPAISIVDQGDGTGATATLSGTEAASTNVVYVQDFTGELGTGVWQNAGTRSGNGTLDLALSAGHYFAYVVSSGVSGTFVSSVVYFVVTDGLDSLHNRCLAAAQARVRMLALAGLTNDNVLVRKVPIDRNLAGGDGSGLPAVVLSPRRAAMPNTNGINGLDDVQYDVLIVIFDRDNQEPTFELNLDRHLLWREQIARAFRNQRLIGVPQIINAEVEPAEGLLEEAWKRELMVSALLVRFTSREPRGFS